MGQSQIHYPGSIQMERLDGGAASRGEAHEQGAVVIPGKMFAPAVLTRMKQRRKERGDRIPGVGFRVFVIVAPLAGEGQIRKSLPSFIGVGIDVLG